MEVVYFLHSKQSDALKIGTTGRGEQRIAALQLSSPEPLDLLGVIPGDRTTEKKLHERFSAYRLRNEWFRAEPEVLEYVAGILAKQAINVPAPPRRGDDVFTMAVKRWAKKLIAYECEWADITVEEAQRRIVAEYGIPAPLLWRLYKGRSGAISAHHDQLIRDAYLTTAQRRMDQMLETVASLKRTDKCRESLIDAEAALATARALMQEIAK